MLTHACRSFLLRKAVTERHGHYRTLADGRRVWVSDHTLNYHEGQGNLFGHPGHPETEQPGLFGQREPATHVTRKPFFLYKKPPAQQDFGEAFRHRQMPAGPISSTRPQQGTESLPLFHQEQQTEERRQEQAQGTWFNKPVVLVDTPAPMPKSQPEPTQPGAPQPSNPTSNYFLRNRESGKLELHFDRTTYQDLPDDKKRTIKSRFLWSPSAGAWVSRTTRDHYFAEQTATELGLSDAGTSGEKLSFAEQRQQFQSSPNPKVGCISSKRISYCLNFGFNPHPTRRLGASAQRSANRAKCSGFNPHPTRRLGASDIPISRARGGAMFQSSPNPKVGCIAA